ncbi:hypothetical protein QVD17_06739 [Tagetes erecta]|uniref:Uncharacterized protein n=1 Tax=Tagetes erecta TaxID=13708 RepID=A0AAD8LL86_TARER|nr:hypothetical protein QVD17_06739 [Tagetes erecta]
MPITFFAIVNQKNVYTLFLPPVVKRLVKSFKIPVGILKLYYEDTFFEVMLHESNDHYFLLEGWERILDYLNLTLMGIVLFNFDEKWTRFSFSFIHANRKYSLGNTFVHFMEKKIPKGVKIPRNFIKRFFSDSSPKNSVPDEEVDDEFMSFVDTPPGFTKKSVLHEWRSFMRLYGLSRGVPCQFVWFRLANVLNVSRLD